MAAELQLRVGSSTHGSCESGGLPNIVGAPRERAALVGSRGAVAAMVGQGRAAAAEVRRRGTETQTLLDGEEES